MNKANIARAFLAAPALLLVAYLISLPVYYLALTCGGGRYAFYIESGYVAAFAAAGFFGLRPVNRIIRDDGSGDTYLLCSLILVLAILSVFQGTERYAAAQPEPLTPAGLNYRFVSDFRSDLTRDGLKDFMKFSSVYICTYAAAFSMSLAMLCRTKWNRYLPELISAVRRYSVRIKRPECGDSSGPANAAHAAGQTSQEKSEEAIRKDMRKRLYAEFEISSDRKEKQNRLI